MAPLPPKNKPKRTAAKDKTSALLGELGIEDEPVGRGRPKGSDSPPKVDPLPTGGARTPAERKLQEKVSRLYMVLGTVLTPFGRFVPQLIPISENIKTFSEDAAEAWMDLARDDAKVKKYLESITGASAWGNVIGIHFAIFASAIPQGVIQQAIPQSDDPIDILRKMGASEQDIEMALRMANGLGDTIRTGGAPVPPVEDIKATEQNGIVSPDQLGVQNPGDEYSEPMVTGGLNK
jgi:hypothetical protein